MKTRWMLLVAAVLAVASISTMGVAKDAASETKVASEEKCPADCKCPKCESAIKLTDLKCPISGHDIDEEAVVEHNGGKIFMCCDKCVGAFAKDMGKDGEKKFLAKANYQLVASNQAKQKGCPMSGGKVKDETKIKVGPNEIMIGFCCEKCQAHAGEAEGDDQIAMLFSAKAFDKAFKVATKDDKEKETK